MRVLVLGAGYIGVEAAIELRRGGHEVTAVVRTDKEQKTLLQNEVDVVVGDASDAKVIDEIVDRCEVVVDCLPPNFATKDLFEGNRRVLQLIAEKSLKGSRRKRAIYISGCLVYGDSPKVRTEADEPTSAIGAGRVQFENDVLGTNAVDGCVLRPGFVYGKHFGKYAAAWFQKDGVVKIDGNPKKVYSWIHIVDLARAIRAVVEAPANIVRGQVYNVADSTRCTYEEFLTVMARVAGNKDKTEFVPVGKDGWSQYKEQSCMTSSAKLTRDTNWRPVFDCFLDDIERYYRAFQSYQ